MKKIATAVVLSLLPVYAMGATSMTGSFGQTQNLGSLQKTEKIVR